MRIEAVQGLDAGSEALLRRAVAEAMPDDADFMVKEIRAALETGEKQACCLYDAGGVPRGVAVWGWGDSTREAAAVDWLTLDSGSPARWGRALVDHLWKTLTALPSLLMIAARLRGQPPGVRGALRRRGAVVFERCLMVRDLLAEPLPVVETPAGIRVARWADEHQPEAEAVAMAAHAGGVDEVVVIEARPGQLVESLRAIRAGRHPEMGRWHEAASLVALAADGDVIAYLAVADLATMGFVADLGVRPDHRRRGLGRLLMVRSMTICREEGCPAMGLAVTTANPARRLYDGLGFRATRCGQTAVWWRDGRQSRWRERHSGGG